MMVIGEVKMLMEESWERRRRRRWEGKMERRGGTVERRGGGGTCNEAVPSAVILLQPRTMMETLWMLKTITAEEKTTVYTTSRSAMEMPWPPTDRPAAIPGRRLPGRLEKHLPRVTYLVSTPTYRMDSVRGNGAALFSSPRRVELSNGPLANLIGPRGEGGRRMGSSPWRPGSPESAGSADSRKSRRPFENFAFFALL